MSEEDRIIPVSLLSCNIALLDFQRIALKARSSMQAIGDIRAKYCSSFREVEFVGEMVSSRVKELWEKASLTIQD